MTDDLRRRKKLALEIAAQLPEDPHEALAVLTEARELITSFMLPPPTPIRIVRN